MNFRSFNKKISLAGAKCSQDNGHVLIQGKHGAMQYRVPSGVNINFQASDISFDLKNEVVNRKEKTEIGTFISLLKSGIIGVSKLHDRKVIFQGTGISVKIEQNKLAMKIGKSHIVYKDILDGLECKIESSDVKKTVLIIQGTSKELVTRFASELITKRPYKGGIHIFLEGRQLKLKESKSA
jgi:ribosomal protein L6P/L9E